VFTGIIEKTGRIRTVRRKAQGASIEFDAPDIAADLKTGDSIAVNGVCLTVTRSDAVLFSAELSAETLERTTFGAARPGLVMNLERPLTLSDRLGGHLVQGHVDGVGRLTTVTQAGDGFVIGIEYPAELQRYFVLKGSVALDGISLTIASLQGTRFTVAVIPHTWHATNLGRLEPGDSVNLEVDMLGKYFDRFVQLGLLNRERGGLTLDYLKEQGF
jgi:riboflavin synthase